MRRVRRHGLISLVALPSRTKWVVRHENDNQRKHQQRYQESNYAEQSEALQQFLMGLYPLNYFGHRKRKQIGMG